MTAQDAKTNNMGVSFALALGWGLLLSVLALLTVQIGSTHLSLQFLPLAAVVLWPRSLSPTLSYLAMFIIGLFADILSGNPLGLSSLILMICYFELNDYDWKGKSLGGYWFVFIATVGLASLCLIILARLFLGIWVPIVPLLYNNLFVIAVFPIVYAIWSALRLTGGTEPDTRLQL